MLAEHPLSGVVFVEARLWSTKEQGRNKGKDRLQTAPLRRSGRRRENRLTSAGFFLTAFSCICLFTTCEPSLVQQIATAHLLSAVFPRERWKCEGRQSWVPSAALIKQADQKQLGGRKSLFSICLQVTIHHRDKSRREPQRNPAAWLTHSLTHA